MRELSFFTVYSLISIWRIFINKTFATNSNLFYMILVIDARMSVLGSTVLIA